jgi:hypothetical protein
MIKKTAPFFIRLIFSIISSVSAVKAISSENVIIILYLSAPYIVIDRIIILTRSNVNDGVKKYFKGRYLLYATNSLIKNKKKKRDDKTKRK